MFTHLPTLQDVSELTEEEQLALALQMSMQQGDMEAELKAQLQTCRGISQ